MVEPFEEFMFCMLVVYYLIDLTSLFAVPILIHSIYNECNYVALANITNIIPLDDVLCKARVYSIAENWTSISNLLPCNLITQNSSVHIVYNPIKKENSTCIRIAIRPSDLVTFFDQDIFYVKVFLVVWILTIAHILMMFAYCYCKQKGKIIQKEIEIQEAIKLKDLDV